ncbi:MAG: flippase-like domain-containing protein [Clostridia bacterium]|nr:flippase-like domain-containing protein [Clostridia bacterium]
MKSKKSILINATILIICLAATFYYMFRNQDLAIVWGYIENGQLGYALLGVIFVLIFIMTESVIIWYICHNLGNTPNLIRCFYYSFVGFFFSLITPSASGGQPMQLVFMKKDKIPMHTSSLALLVVTIGYKLVLVIVGAIVLIFRPKALMVYLEPVMFWMYLGMALNVIIIGGMLCLIFFPRFTKKLVMGIFNLIARIINSRRFDTYEHRIEKTADKYAENAEYFMTHKKVIFNVILLSIVQRFALFFVTYLGFACLGVDDANIITIIMLQACISMAVDMLPLPGGLGITEHLFSVVFMPICGAALITPVMVVARGLNFYTQLIICALCTLIGYFVFYSFERKKKK